MHEIAFPSEKTIEDFVFSRLSAGDVCPISNEIVTRAFRQYEIKGYGVTDIVKVLVCPGGIEIKILELKNETLKEAHLGQLSRYMRGAERVAKKYRRFLPASWEITVSGELAGPFEPDSNNLVYMLQHLQEDITVWSIALDMESGFQSKEVGRGWFSRNECRRQHSGLVRDVFGFFRDIETYLGTPPKHNVVPMGGRRG